VPDPAEGLYSETDVTSGGPAQDTIDQGPLEGYMRGDASWADVQDAVRHWRRSVGGTIRAEFETCWASLHG
jgi:hypothetical protein